MHDIDRISFESPYPSYETNGEYSQFEANQYGQYENEFSPQYENENEFSPQYENENEFTPQYDLEEESSYETLFEDSYENENESDYEDAFEEESYETQGLESFESPFSEEEELALASELLNVTNEDELDQFIGKLLKTFKGLSRTPLGSQLGGIIKGAAKTALPMLGAAAGNFLVPGVGGVMGSKLASAAGSMLGLEVEGLSREDQEFQLARQLVRFGGAAARNAEEIEQTAPPSEAAQQAAVSAAQQYAPFQA